MTRRESPRYRLENPGVRREVTDMSIGWVFGFMALLVATGVAIHLLTGLLLTDLRRPGGAEAGHARPFVTGPGSPPPARAFTALGASGLPVQQVAPGVELRDLRQHERDLLRAWGWEDTAYGPVVPIGRALDALAADGQPVRRERR